MFKIYLQNYVEFSTLSFEAYGQFNGSEPISSSDD